MSSNNQLPHDYHVMEHFYTIQGEGSFRGRAAYFIRLGGCNVGCVWCDVKESWDKNQYKKIDLHALIDEVLQTGAKIAVITGGEPSEYNLLPITMLLKQHGINTHLETAATNEITGVWDWICISPKKFKPVLYENYKLANELKVIVYNKSDLIFAEQQATYIKSDCILTLQPEWSKMEVVMPDIVDYVKKNPKWCISIQEHKFINVP